MRQHILYICTTYYQLILAIHMKYNIKENCFSDVILTDNSKNADKIVKNLNDNKVFDHSFYAASSHLDMPVRSIAQFVSDTLKASVGINKELKRKLKKNQYDEMIFYNQNMFVYMVYAYIAKYNSAVMLSRYEEGITSYNLQYAMEKSIRRQALILIRKIMGKKVLDNAVQKFYCMYPKLYHGDLRVDLIPEFERNKRFVADINKTFGITKIPAIKEKYIYFVTAHDYRSINPIGEQKLLLKLADLLGKENLIVKNHPRVNLSEIKNRNIKIYKDSYIPWEAILFNENYADHVFLTSISGSLLLVNLMQEKGAETYFLYPLLKTDCNDRAMGMIKAFEEMKDIYSLKGFSRIHIIQNWKELNECLSDL